MCSSKLSVNCEYADTWVRSIPAEEKILFVPAADAAISRAPQSATIPLNLNEQPAARQGESSARFKCPGQPVQRKDGRLSGLMTVFE